MTDDGVSAAAEVPHFQCSHCASVASKENLVRERNGLNICARCGWQIFESKEQATGQKSAWMIPVTDVKVLYHCASCNRTAHEDSLFDRVKGVTDVDGPDAKPLADKYGLGVVAQAIEIATSLEQKETTICKHCGSVGSIEAYELPRTDGLVVGDDGTVEFPDGETVNQQVETTSEEFWSSINEYMRETHIDEPEYIAGFVLHNYSQPIVEYLLRSEPRAVWLEVQSMSLGAPINECSDSWFRKLNHQLRKEVDGIAPGYVDFDESDEYEEEPEDMVGESPVPGANFLNSRLGEAIGIVAGALANIFRRPAPQPEQQPQLTWLQSQLWLLAAKQQLKIMNEPARAIHVGGWLVIPRSDFIAIDRAETDGQWVITVTYWGWKPDGKTRAIVEREIYFVEEDARQKSGSTMRAVFAQLQRPSEEEARWHTLVGSGNAGSIDAATMMGFRPGPGTQMGGLHGDA